LRKRQALIAIVGLVAGIAMAPLVRRIGVYPWQHAEMLLAIFLIGSSVLWLWYMLEHYRALGERLLVVPYSIGIRFVLYGGLVFYVVLVAFSTSVVATGSAGWSSLLILLVNLPTYLFVLVRLVLRVQIREEGIASDLVTYRWRDLEGFEWTGSATNVLMLYHRRTFATLWTRTASIHIDPEYRPNVTILLRSAGVPQLSAGQRLARD
jgi:hypothetical protein